MLLCRRTPRRMYHWAGPCWDERSTEHQRAAKPGSLKLSSNRIAGSGTEVIVASLHQAIPRRGRHLDQRYRTTSELATRSSNQSEKKLDRFWVWRRWTSV